MDKLQDTVNILKEYKQDHIIRLLEKLNKEQQEELIKQIATIDFHQIMELYNNTKKMNYNYFSKDSLKRYDRILKGDITALNLDDINSDGYIVNTLECVLYMFLKSNDYNTTILEGVNLGNDTDTIGSCLGGLLGLYYGLDSIKESWRKNIIKYDYIIDLCNKFENIILGKKA